MSTLQRYRFTIKIRFAAPIVSQAAGAIGHGIDTAPLLNQDDFPLLPGTLLAGNLREIWENIADHGQKTAVKELILAAAEKRKWAYRWKSGGSKRAKKKYDA